jgi:Glycosyltransferase family 87
MSITESSFLSMKKNESLRTFKLLLAALVAFSLLFNLQILWAKRSYIAKGYGDFVIYYTGAEIVNAGKASELYDLNVQQAYQERFKRPNQPWSVLPFNHAPYELAIFLPLAHLSYQAAHLVWSVLSIILLVITFRILVPFVDCRNKLLFGALLFGFYPTMVTLKMGQDSVLSLFIFSGVFASLKAQHETLAGSILALGLYKPHLVLPLAGILLLTRHWRTAVGFTAMTACLAAFSFAMVGWRGIGDVFSIVATMDRPTTIVYPEFMTNLRGLAFLLLSAVGFASVTNIVTVFASIIVYGFCLFLWRRPIRPGVPLFDLRFSLAIVTTILVSYHLYAHDVIILVVPLILTFSCVLEDRVRTTIARNGFLLVLLLLYLPLVPYFLELKGRFAWGVLPMILFYVVVALEIYYSLWTDEVSMTSTEATSA